LPLAEFATGWEDKRGSGVTLAMRLGDNGIPTNGLSGLGKGDKHSACTPLEYNTITFTLAPSSSWNNKY